MFRPKSDKGITLIELMIIVAIVAILAAIAIPQVVLLRDKGRVKRGLPPLHPEIYYKTQRENDQSKYEAKPQAVQSGQSKLNCVCTPQ